MFEKDSDFEEGEEVFLRAEINNLPLAEGLKGKKLFIENAKDHKSAFTGQWFTLKDEAGNQVKGKEVSPSQWNIVFPASWFCRLYEIESKIVA